MSNTAVNATKTWDTVVELSHVTKYFDQKRPVSLLKRELHRVYALNDVSFTLRKGEFAAYAGPNGAGKSTTFKLLKSYSLMEKQSYQGENIVASRKKIEDILDSLITAFEQQQDRLFRTEAMDVEADIQVLETMMAKDGLVTPKGLDLRAMGGK